MIISPECAGPNCPPDVKKIIKNNFKKVMFSLMLKRIWSYT